MSESSRPTTFPAPGPEEAGGARPKRERRGWYVRRLLTMSPAEVAVRGCRYVRHTLDDLAWKHARALWRRRWEPPAPRILATRPAGRTIGFLNHERADGLRRRDPPEASRIADAAGRALAGRVRFFGYPEVELSHPADYSLDPLSGRRWPDRHAKRVDYRHEAIGDPKLIWELNRCQNLPLLVQAWLLSGDDRFAAAALEQMLEWIDQQPPGRGIAWSNGFEAGMRAISLALNLDALRASNRLTGPEAEVIARALWQHGRWILRDPSTHSSANNHRIGELVGLLTIAVLVPELNSAPRWEQLALAGLAEEANKQIRGDGTGAEQAFAYHVFVVDLLLLALALLRGAGRSDPPALIGALDRAADALSAQLGDGEPPPSYGDADEGRAARLDGSPARDPRGVASALAAALGHGGARRVAGALDSTAWWLFGEEGARQFDDTAPAPAPGSIILPEGGLVLLRRDAHRVLVDAGPHGYLRIAAHAHADALHLALCVGGEELIVDPGVGSYFGDPEVRAAFRGTGFHATVVVDGRDQSEAAGPFLWRSHARARLVALDLEGGVVIAEHDGYCRLADPVRHRRVVIALPDGLVLVHDSLAARGSHRYAQRWPLHPVLEADQPSADLVHVTRAGEPRLLVAFAASHPARLRLARGQRNPPAGWFSPGLESWLPAWHASWESAGVGTVAIAALLWSVSGQAWPEPDLSLEQHHDGSEIAFTTGAGRSRIFVDRDGPRLVTTPVRVGGAARENAEIGR